MNLLKFGTLVPWISPENPIFASFAHGPAKWANSSKPISCLSFRPKLLKFGTHVPLVNPDKSTNPLFEIFVDGPGNGQFVCTFFYLNLYLK